MLETSEAIPPKRKRLKVGGDPATKRRSAEPSTAAAAPAKFKYSNTDTIPKELPKLIICLWPKNDDDDEDEPSETASETARQEAEQSRVVDDRGVPYTRLGFEKFQHIDEEQSKRDRIVKMFISVMITRTMFAEFNKVLFKKDVSPLEKWAYVEALIPWTRLGDMYSLMMNADSESVRETFEMFISIIITSFEMLAEHNLIDETSAVSNVGVVTQFMILILHKDATEVGFKLPDIKEIVRAVDKYGVKLVPRKEIGLKEEDFEKLRKACKGAAKRNNWKADYAKYKRQHPGGSEYDITKMSKAERKQYSFGD